MIPVIAVVNLLVACIRLYYSIKQRKLIALAWFLIAYFSFFYIPVSITGDFRHVQKFTDGSVMVTSDYIYKVVIFVFLFNSIFLLSELLFNSLLIQRKFEWNLSKGSSAVNKLTTCFALMLLFSSIAFGVSTWEFGYRNYVEYQGSSWSLVFLWAASPLIVLAALQKRYWLACLATIPYLYFAAAMSVRSFALLSIVPLMIVYGQQTVSSETRRSAIIVKKIVTMGLLSLILLICSSLIIQQKSGRGAGLTLPDSSMPFNSAVLFKLSDSQKVRTGWDSLALYGQNIVNPFTRLLGIKSGNITDPPVVIARLVEGLPNNWPVYFHYPTLWYSDAYLAFGYAGLWLAVFWAVILVTFEWLFTRNTILCAVFLPYYSWHAYMVVRGAPAGAAVPFSYAAYVSIITAFIFFGTALLKQTPFHRVIHPDETMA